jgi:eukaryotic-like serine/threonine-protein kinase
VQPGDLVSGKYRLQRLLGAGSMGTVWAARNELTNRDFAIKFLKPTLSRNREALNRFFHEARACGQIRHPAIVDVLDVGNAEDGAPFLVMELLEGEGLDARLARQPRIPAVDLCVWMSIVSRGLEEAHLRGLIHRDLKPGNIYFASMRSGEVCPKILDFGISKAVADQPFEFVQTSSGAVLGSPAYMSPEQARGDAEIDARSDIWSLGVIMYEATTGQLPFGANNYNALMMAIMSMPHPPVQLHAPECPPALAGLLDECLSKERGKRVRSAAQLAERLERIHATLTQSPILHPERSLTLSRVTSVRSTQSTWSRVREAVKERPWATIPAGALLLAALGLGGYFSLNRAGEPLLASPGRFGPVVTGLVARATGELELAKARAEQGAAPAPTVVLDLDEAEHHKAGKGASPKAKATAKANDPHGGVDSAGF